MGARQSQLSAQPASRGGNAALFSCICLAPAQVTEEQVKLLMRAERGERRDRVFGCIHT